MSRRTSQHASSGDNVNEELYAREADMLLGLGSVNTMMPSALILPSGSAAPTNNRKRTADAVGLPTDRRGSSSPAEGVSKAAAMGYSHVVTTIAPNVPLPRTFQPGPAYLYEPLDAVEALHEAQYVVDPRMEAIYQHPQMHSVQGAGALLLNVPNAAPGHLALLPRHTVQRGQPVMAVAEEFAIADDYSHGVQPSMSSPQIPRFMPVQVRRVGRVDAPQQPFFVDDGGHPQHSVTDFAASLMSLASTAQLVEGDHASMQMMATGARRGSAGAASQQRPRVWRDRSSSNARTHASDVVAFPNVPAGSSANWTDDEKRRHSAEWFRDGCYKKWNLPFCPQEACLQDIPTAELLVEHILHIEAEDQTKCMYCDYVQEKNVRKHKLRTHLQRHFHMPFRCKCGVTYAQREGFHKHLRKRSGEPGHGNALTEGDAE